MISILPPCRPDRFLFRGLVAVLRIAALLVAIATFSAVAVSQTVNDPEIALVQNRFETYRDAVNEVRAAQTRDWNHVPPELMQTLFARLAEFESALIPHWREVLDDPNLNQKSAEDTKAILARLEQRLGAEEYMAFLMKCVDLRERGVIDSTTLERLFFGNLAFPESDGGDSVKEEFLAANYKALQVRAFIERATPYLKQTELGPGLEATIRDILSGKRNLSNWDRLDYHIPPLLLSTKLRLATYPLALILIVAILFRMWRRRKAAGVSRKCAFQ